jgi:hypothetical protein
LRNFFEAFIELCASLRDALFVVGSGAMWTEYSGSDFEWDKLVTSFENSHPSHLFHWTMATGRNGLVRRLVFSPAEGKPPTAVIQFLQKTLNFGWFYFRSDGGLAGDHSALSSLPAWASHTSGHKHWYLRVFSRTNRSAASTIEFQSAGFAPVENRIHTGLSAQINLTNPHLGAYTGNWKHNLARSQKKNLVISFPDAPSLGDLVSIFRNLQTIKNIGEQFSQAELHHIISAFGAKLIMVQVHSPTGQLLSVRAALVAGAKAFDLLAATSDSGRAQYASNLAFHRLLAKCAGMGVTFYDCAGIDPRHGKGVMQFKMGAGGLPFEYAGEWECSSNRFTGVIMNAAVKLKLWLKS